MNVADSQRVASALERLAYEPAENADTADVIVLNTCVVRQSAEDKAYGRISVLKSLKKKRPDLVINVMGCLVGIKPNPKLMERFPYVDVFSQPADPGPLVAYLTQREAYHVDQDETADRYVWMDDHELVLPLKERGKLVSAFMPVVYGCSHACSFCIIPYRRGVEHSRSPQDILQDVESLVSQGVKEVTLLGQIVDRYGLDETQFPGLDGLLRRLNDIQGLERIRFLTSHPNWITDELLTAVAELPKVMPHIEVPVQAGDDTVLANMRRGYTVDQYRRLVHRIRERIPGVAIATDVIVGFPGETEDQFQRTYDLLAELRMDVAHLARYSTRQGTLADRKMPDDVSEDEKWRRFRLLEALQKEIATDINAQYLSTSVPVLFEEKVKQRWKGRTPTNKLVFVEAAEDLRGRVLPVRIDWTGPWSMIGMVEEQEKSN